MFSGHNGGKRNYWVFLCSRICDYLAGGNVPMCLSLLTGNLSDSTDIHTLIKIGNLNPGSSLKENMDNDMVGFNSRWQIHYFKISRYKLYSVSVHHASVKDLCHITLDEG